MTQKEAYVIIRCWECEAGENFFEYFIGNCNNIVVPKLVLWLYKKNYISLEKLNLYADKYIAAKEWFEQPDYEVLCGYEDMYSLFPYGECDELANFKAESILAEFIVTQETFCKRLYDFVFKGKGWSSIEDNQDEVSENEQRMKEVIQTWSDKDNDGFDKILELSITEINERLEKEYTK